MKKLLSILTLALCTTQSYSALVNLNTNEFNTTFKNLNKEKGYMGEIKSSALTGGTHEKFIVTGKKVTYDKEPIAMTGYYVGPTEIGNTYSIAEYHVYCEDQAYNTVISGFEPNGELSFTTLDTDYAFDYEDPTDRDKKFSQILKKACKYKID